MITTSTTTDSKARTFSVLQRGRRRRRGETLFVDDTTVVLAGIAHFFAKTIQDRYQATLGWISAVRPRWRSFPSSFTDLLFVFQPVYVAFAVSPNLIDSI